MSLLIKLKLCNLIGSTIKGETGKIILHLSMLTVKTCLLAPEH